MKPDIHILVVDDSDPMREFVVQAIESREGFTVSQAADGKKGLQMALTEPLPDLILLDLEMPRLNGFQVLDTLREQENDVPVILITSHGSEVIAVEMFRKGVRDYLIKPFTPEDMYAAIDRALIEVCLRREKETLTARLSEANLELRNRVQELDTLYNVGKSVTALLPRDQVLERILQAVFSVVSAEEATLMLRNEETERMEVVLHRQRVPGELQQSARRTAEQLANEAIKKGDATASGAMLYAPLKVADETIGALGVGNRVSTKPFSRYDRQLLLALSDYAAIAIANARLFDEVQQADKAKSEFVSFVSHELRTPMTSIRGYADMLMKGHCGELNPQQEQFMQVVLNNAIRMQILVSDLQDVSRIETGRLHLEMETTTLETAVQAAIQATQQQINARSQKLTVEVPDDLPPVRADPARLAQILINLLSNAYKYTPEGGRIKLRAWCQDGFVHCAVTDTGVGISPEDQGRLFTKFFRSEDPAVREMPGTGLGLCIVRSLVELQGGQINFDSQIGKGTTFTFTIPVAATS